MIPVFPNPIPFSLINTEFGPDEKTSTGLGFFSTQEFGDVVARATYADLYVDSSLSYGGTITIILMSLGGKVEFLSKNIVLSAANVYIYAKTTIKIGVINAFNTAHLVSGLGLTPATTITKIQGADASSAGVKWIQGGLGPNLSSSESDHGTAVYLRSTPRLEVPNLANYSTSPVTSNLPAGWSVTSTSPPTINRLFTTPSFYGTSFVIPDGFNYASGTVIGGGGGGGGGTASFDEGRASAGGGGGGGVVTFSPTYVVPGHTLSVTVGAGGTGRAASGGNRSGTTGDTNVFSNTSGLGGSQSVLSSNNGNGSIAHPYDWNASADGGQGSYGVYWKFYGTAPVALGGGGNAIRLIASLYTGSSGGAMVANDNPGGTGGRAGGFAGGPLWGAGGVGGSYNTETSIPQNGANGANYGGGGGGGSYGGNQTGTGGGGNGANGVVSLTLTDQLVTTQLTRDGKRAVIITTPGAGPGGSLPDFANQALGPTFVDLFPKYVAFNIPISRYYRGGTVVYSGASSSIPTTGPLSLSNFHATSYVPWRIASLSNDSHAVSGFATGAGDSVFTRAGFEFRSDGNLYYYSYISNDFPQTTYVAIPGKWMVRGTPSDYEWSIVEGEVGTIYFPTIGTGGIVGNWYDLGTTRLVYIETGTAGGAPFLSSHTKFATVKVSIRLKEYAQLPKREGPWTATFNLTADATWDSGS